MTLPNPNNFITNAKYAIGNQADTALENFVSEVDQLLEIESISQIVQHEKFFVIVNSLEQKVEQAIGVYKWLGYEDSTFTFDKYLKIIHPGFMNSLIQLAASMNEMVKSKEVKLTFRQDQYVINIALRHAKGHYVLCKRSLSPWQICGNIDRQMVTHYCNEFTIIDRHIDPSDTKVETELFPRLLNQNSDKLKELEQKFKGIISNTIQQKVKVFSPTEILVLRKWAYQNNTTSKAIAIELNLAVETINTLNKRALEKGRYFFQDETINSAQVLASLLRKNFLI